MNGAVDANGAPKTLYVGNLDHQVIIQCVSSDVNTLVPRSQMNSLWLCSVKLDQSRAVK